MTIQILPARLANQIAAGEVVERPASVVKELVENSLDAGATVIDIDIRQGGHKEILIRDNGKGIEKHQLSLALSRHATSKISSLDDLERITSMGFRGEALASISSVSRLTLTSKPEAQTEAWQAHAEGREMDVQVTPAAHPNGTSIRVTDLFFNTPARRKFLRSEKTEFVHIEEIVKRIALSRFDVAFCLKHNGKSIKRYAKAAEQQQQLNRIAQACHRQFLSDALQLSVDYQNLVLSGYLLPLESLNQTKDMQYIYVNGRVMRDRVINHAVRQAFELAQRDHQQFAYILYLQLPPEQIDINVHPAKHEVRFHQGRLVHDFIQRAIRDTLIECLPGQAVVNRVMEPEVPNHDYIRPLQQQVQANLEATPGTRGVPRDHHSSVSRGAGKSYQQLMASPENKAISGDVADWMYINPRFLLVYHDKQFYRLASVQLLLAKISYQLTQPWVLQPLLMPVSVSISHIDDEPIATFIEQSKATGMALVRVHDRLILKQVASVLRTLNWSQLLPDVVNKWLTQGGEPNLLLHQAITDNQQSFALTEVQGLWAELSEQQTQLREKLITAHGTLLPLEDWMVSQ